MKQTKTERAELLNSVAVSSLSYVMCQKQLGLFVSRKAKITSEHSSRNATKSIENGGIY